MSTLDRLHARIRANPWLARFTALTRVMVALGFIPSGMTKLLGNRFTELGVDTSVGFFFEAFFRNQLWYRTIGLAQVLAALLLILPRTSHLGAILFFPIILNIWLITIGIEFAGTWVITSLMLLANLWLLAWEYDRVAPLLAIRPAGPPGRESAVAWAGVFALLGIAAYGGLYALNIALVRTSPGPTGFAIAAVAGGIFGAIVAWHARGIR